MCEDCCFTKDASSTMNAVKDLVTIMRDALQNQVKNCNAINSTVVKSLNCIAINTYVCLDIHLITFFV